MVENDLSFEMTQGPDQALSAGKIDTYTGNPAPWEVRQGMPGILMVFCIRNNWKFLDLLGSQRSARVDPILSATTFALLLFLPWP